MDHGALQPMGDYRLLRCHLHLSNLCTTFRTATSQIVPGPAWRNYKHLLPGKCGLDHPIF